MAVTQYIGARYVPMFADPVEWTNTKRYEPLTIVLYGGNSYTSRQWVPVGVDITNADYWVETGNYNGQIETYRQEVLGFDSRITQNADDISEMREDVTTNTENIATLSDTVDGYSEDIANLKETVEDHTTEISGIQGSVEQHSDAIEDLQYESATIFTCKMRDAIMCGSHEGLHLNVQGSVVFSLNDNYQYGNSSLYYASVEGASPSTKTLNIYNYQQTLISSTSMPAVGNFGHLTYHDGKIYAFNKVNSPTEGDGRLYVADVSRPTAPTFTTQTLPAAPSNDGYWWGVCNYGEKLALYCSDSFGVFSVYSYDVSTSALVHLFDTEYTFKTLNGATIQHFTYSEKYDAFVLNVHTPNTLIVYDNTGAIKNMIDIPDFIGYSFAGELEDACIYDDVIFFTCRVQQVDYVAIGSTSTASFDPEVVQYFYFNVDVMRNMPYRPLITNTKVVIDYQGIVDGACYYDSTNKEIHVKYDYQACICAQMLPNAVPEMEISSNYPYIFVAYHLTSIRINPTNATLKVGGFACVDCSNLQVGLYDTNFTENSYFVISAISATIRAYAAASTVTFNHNMVASFTTGILLGLNRCFVMGVDVSNAILATSLLKCRNLSAANLTNWSCGICLSETDVTKSANSGTLVYS